jgi:hypothetical protein
MKFLGPRTSVMLPLHGFSLQGCSNEIMTHLLWPAWQKKPPWSLLSTDACDSTLSEFGAGYCWWKQLTATFCVNVLLTQVYAMARAVSRRPLTAEAGVRTRVSLWDLWWTVWHWDRRFSEFFGSPPSVSFHRVSPYSYICVCGGGGEQ